MFFNPEAPRFMNYGSIGTIIGHEISHGFDDAGRTMDSNGVYRNWWSPEAEAEYHSRARCVVDLYSTFFSDQVNATLDGVATQGENIADIMGNLVAYRGYEIWMEENGVTEEPGLPGLPFTARQMFWISNGRHYCRKIRDQALLKKIKSDSHSPMEFRINGALMNSDEFAKDFNCPKGSPMNPEKKCYMW